MPHPGLVNTRLENMKFESKYDEKPGSNHFFNEMNPVLPATPEEKSIR